MKLFISLATASILAASALAAPTVSPTSLIIDITPKEAAQQQAHEAVLVAQAAAQEIGTEADEFANGGCRSVIYFYARGTGQAGNIGQQPGPQAANALKARLGSSVGAIQGVNYTASLLGNLASGGAPASEAASFTSLLTRASTQCPTSKLVVSGYSQGAALVHRAIEATSTAVKARIFAAVTYGDTQRQQDNGQIPGFYKAKTLILCNDGDKVCDGTLIITAKHTDYTGSVPAAVSFIASKV